MTDDGEVKLADFGVSAILKNPSEKRKSLIGTPYWMAPEVSQNKLNPTLYDYSCDIWSLGVTALEMADKHPPLSHVPYFFFFHLCNFLKLPPLRALTQIPLRSAPKLAQPTSWSTSFNQFIESCVQKDPTKRLTAGELHQHPFITVRIFHQQIGA